MTDTFFSQLEGTAVCELLSRTGLQDAALIVVGASLRIENCNAAAAGMTGLHPLDPIAPVLSEYALQALRICIAAGEPRTVYEELDGTTYRLELIPHREGALLAFLRCDRAAYDGSLRVLHAKSAQYLGALLADARQIEDPALAGRIRRGCLQLHRLLNHSDFLHDPPQTEQLRLQYCDLAVLCRTAAEAVAGADRPPVEVRAPHPCSALVEPGLIRTALYNLLTNALRVTTKEEGVTVTLRDDGIFYTITIADRGPGLDPRLFDWLLEGWHRTMPLKEYLSLVRHGAPLGLGLPLTQCIAHLHGGHLLFSPREGGGSELHLSIAHLPDTLADHNLYAPMIMEDGWTVEEIELSILD